MAKKTITRRELLFPENHSVTHSQADGDKLFEKYSRKDYNIGKNGAGKDLSPVNKSTGITAELKSGFSSGGLEPYTGQWGIREVLHLLRRTNYGFKYPNVQDLERLTMSEAVGKILNIGKTMPPPPVN